MRGLDVAVDVTRARLCLEVAQVVSLDAYAKFLQYGCKNLAYAFARNATGVLSNP